MILKNIESEGPGSIEDYLREAGTAYKIVEHDSIGLIDSLDGYDTLIVLGGPMGVYEIDKYPWLSDVLRLIKEAGAKGRKRVLGVCLGAQLMAHAFGGSVYKGKAGEEAGWLDVTLTSEGMNDPVIGALASGKGDNVTVLQWHGDTFTIPAGGVRLAGSKMYENQAFRAGLKAYALQFHIEATLDKIEEWFKDHPKGAEIIATARGGLGDYKARAYRFYERFFRL